MSNIGDIVFNCMFLGYNTNYSNNVYMMWNPDTNIIHNICDIIWLKGMFYQEKLSTGMVADVPHFDDWDINGIEFGEKKWMTVMS